MAHGKLVGISSAKLLSDSSVLDSGAVQVQGPRPICTSARKKPAGIFEACVAEVQLYLSM